MIKCAILEDDETQAQTLKSFLERFGEEKGELFEVHLFANAVTFLENYTASYDMAFIDIRMPYISGIEASKLLRKKDEKIVIIFVTSLAQYAIEGYAVDATDYLLKPLRYADFALSMSRAMRKLTRDENMIVIPAKEGNIRIKTGDIIYIETQGHSLIYHTAGGEYARYAPLRTAIKELQGKGFSLCNRCYLVNLGQVQSVKGYTVTVGGAELQISQPRKKQFLLDLKEHTGD